SLVAERLGLARQPLDLGSIGGQLLALGFPLQPVFGPGLGELPLALGEQSLARFEIIRCWFGLVFHGRASRSWRYERHNPQSLSARSPAGVWGTCAGGRWGNTAILANRDREG